MTLDDVLRSVLQGPNVRAIVLFDELYIPLAVRGSIDKTDVQYLMSRISQTIVGTLGQITLNDGRLAQFHHAETHTVVLIKDTSSSPELIYTQASNNNNNSNFENTIGSPSSISTATPAKEQQYLHAATAAAIHRSHSPGSNPILAPRSSANLSISTISASVETIKGWNERKGDGQSTNTETTR